MLSYLAIAPCCIKENWCFPGKDALFSVAIGLPVASEGMQKAKYRATVQIVNTTTSGMTKIYLINSVFRSFRCVFVRCQIAKGKTGALESAPFKQTKTNTMSIPKYLLH
jgi:hypothetical protein